MPAVGQLRINRKRAVRGTFCLTSDWRWCGVIRGVTTTRISVTSDRPWTRLPARGRRPQMTRDAEVLNSICAPYWYRWKGPRSCLCPNYQVPLLHLRDRPHTQVE